MSEHEPKGARRQTVPRLPLRVLGAWLPHAERDEVLAELTEEFNQRRERQGYRPAKAWLYRQALASLPSLMRRTFTRGWTGFEPRSSELRPGGPWMESLIIDVRYAARRLRSRPLYAALVVFTLALAVGGTAAAFGLVRGLLLSPLPYPDEDRLAVFWNQRDWSQREFLYLSGDWQGFSGVAAYRPTELPLRRSPDAAPELVAAVTTSSGLFDVLGVHAALGRVFERGEDGPGAAPAVVISEALYRDLGSDPSIVGRMLELDGKGFTVVGVMPKGFWFPDPTVRVWAAEPFTEQNGAGNYVLIARRAPGTDGPVLQAALQHITSRLKQAFQYPEQWDKTRSPHVTPVREAFLGELQAPLWATLAAMAVLLLIACANVTALMLGQVDSRATELAVRVALGADQRRMTQQLIAEAALLGLGASATGGFVAAQGFAVLSRALPLGNLAARSSLDWTVFFATLSLALAASVAVALVAARSLRKADPQRALAQARMGGIGARGGRTEGALVVGQVALAVLLTAGSALLVRTVVNLRSINPGLDVEHTAALDVVMESNVAPEARRRLLSDLESGLASLPGVRAAGITLKLPLRGPGQSWGIQIEGKPDLPKTTTYVRLVTPGYFDAIGMRLVDGRLFSSDDRENTEPVAVINRALAAKYFPGENPIGQRLLDGGDSPTRIVGIVQDAAEARLSDGGVPTRYLLYSQLREYTPTQHTIVLRAASGHDPAALLDSARRQIMRTSGAIAVQRTLTLKQVFSLAVGPAQQVMTVLSLLTTFAILLGAVGVYGVMAHSVRRRQRDLAVRLALGMPPSRAIAQVVRRAGLLVLAGSAIGVVAAILLARLLSSLLYGVHAIDPLSLAGAILALLAVGLAAAAVPAFRASRVDPASVFREG